MDDINLPKQENDVLPPLCFEPVTKHVDGIIVSRVNCIKCAKFFAFPEEKDDCLGHIFLEHRLVIADVDDIVLLEEYLQFWENEFKNCSFEEHCTTLLLDHLPDGTPGKNERYYLLSDVSRKDYKLRRQLKQKLLELVLEQHQFERTDRNFSKECLYCRDVITGLRSEYLEHLFGKHFLQLGKPENLVFIDELLTKVQINLENLVCLFCEKTFKDRTALKEHMRKKFHKRINPNIRFYDKFFLEHYRNETKPPMPMARNYDFKSQCKRMSQRPLLVVPRREEMDRSDLESVSEFEQRFGRGNDDNDENDSDWSDWHGDQPSSFNCLFCTKQEISFAHLKVHMLNEHQLDFDKEVQNLNFYQKIKIVNYVRRHIRLLRCVTCELRCEDSASLLTHMATEKHFGLGTQKQWDKPEYFFPTYEDDGVLCVLDDNLNESLDDTTVKIISEDTLVKINKDAEQLSLEKFDFSDIGF